ncbi:MAG: ABC transporter permease [Anaerolineae bacterium]|nr:ABC transporter permease [Anaerolineae bacterium]
MNLRENVRLALIALRANKLRSFLTMLGMIIGVAAVITLISVGRGVELFVAEQFQGLGNNLLFVFPGQIRPDGPPRQRRAGLTNDDIRALSDPLLVPDLLRVAPEYTRSAMVTRGRYETRTSISGTSVDFPEVRNFRPVAGSFFDEVDETAAARVAVLGQTVYEQLFPNGDPPVGETIKINNVNFRVIGLMEEKGGSGFNDQDNLVLVPLNTAQRRLFPARRSDGKMRIDLIYAQITDSARQEAAIVQMELALRDSHRLAFDEENDFTVLSQAEIISAFAQVTSVLTTFLAVIAGISLLVGGIGIMNIMLVSVTERTREIGLRKAVGAKQGDILWQFLTEAVTIAMVGGAIGLLVGAGGTVVIGSLSDSLSPTLAWGSVVLAIGFSAAVGLFFGIFPARRAARLNPIDALRYE